MLELGYAACNMVARAQEHRYSINLVNTMRSEPNLHKLVWDLLLSDSIRKCCSLCVLLSFGAAD